jgi:hypothetical protein
MKMNINKQHYLSILIFSLILLSFPQTLLSQGERLAVISKFEGEVRIKHEGEWKTVTSVGNRIRNSSVYSNDTVMTMPGSTADLVFDDNTRLEVNEDTTLTISTRQMAERERRQEGFIRRVADTQQDIVRNVNIHVGKIWANVTPSKSVLTEFETPTGVASVRGTILTIEFTRGITTVELIDGLLDFVSAQSEISAVFSTGDVVNISAPRPGNVDVDVESGDGVDVDTGIGTANVGAGEGAEVQVVGDQVTVSADGDITLETSKGTVTIKDGGSLEVIMNPDTGVITVTGVEGVVTITAPDGTIPVNTETDLGTASASDEADAVEAGAATAAMDDPADGSDDDATGDDEEGEEEADGEGGEEVADEGGEGDVSDEEIADAIEGGAATAAMDDPAGGSDDDTTGGDEGGGMDDLLAWVDDQGDTGDDGMGDDNTGVDSGAGEQSQENQTQLDSSTGTEEEVIVPPRIFNISEDNGTLAITESEVLDNVVDADGNPLTIKPPSDGTSDQGGTVAEGSLIYTPLLNYFGPDSFIYEIFKVIIDEDENVDDVYINVGEGTVNINVAAVNDPPTFTGGEEETVYEDAGLQTVNDWASGISKGPANESGQSLTFDMTSDTPDLFDVYPAIDADGNLTYTLADDAYGSAEIYVYLTDSGGTDNGGEDESGPQPLTINVNPVNDPPTSDMAGDQVVNEDAGQQWVDNWASNTSPGPNESDQSWGFEVTDYNPDLFEYWGQPKIDGGGKLTFTPKEDAFGSTEFTVSLTDSGGTDNGGVDESEPQTFTININSVNDSPAFDMWEGDQQVDEDSGPASVGEWATGISSGPANESDQELTFNVTSSNAGLFSVLPAIDEFGNLTYTPADNAFGSASLDVYLTDDGTTVIGGVETDDPRTYEKTFLININSVNDAPTFYTEEGDQQVDEDAGPQTVSGWASGISKGPENESGQLLVFNVTSSNDWLFSVLPAIDPITGNLTYTPADNAFGSANLDVYLTDDGTTVIGGEETEDPQTYTETFLIDVASVNDIPVAVDDDAAGDEDSQLIISDPLANDTDVEDDTLSISDFTQPSSGSLVYGEGSFTYTPDYDFRGDDAFAYTVSDGQGGETTGTVNITVNDIFSGGDSMELLNYYGVGGFAIPEDPSSVVIGNDLFKSVDISPEGYIHWEYDDDGGLPMSINDDDEQAIIADDGFGISFDKTTNTPEDTTDDLVATFRDVDEYDPEEEGPNIEKGGTKGTPFYSRATGNSVVANTSFDDLLISHDWRFTDDGNVLVADVTITNTGDQTISNLKYRRKVDFDIDEDDDLTDDEPIDDFIVPSIDPDDTLIETVAAPLWDSVKTDPTGSDITNSAPGTYEGDIEGDMAAVIQFNLGTLEPDASITFPVFFAADNPTIDELDPLNNITASQNLRDSIDSVVSTTYYIEVSDPSDDEVFALGAGNESNLSQPTEVVPEDVEHFKISTDALSLMIGSLAKTSYSSHAETIADSDTTPDLIGWPMGIAVSNGDLFVTDGGTGSVLRLSQGEAGWNTEVISSEINWPSGIAVSNGALFVTDGGSVLRLSYGEGSWNTEVIADYDINWPTGIAVDNNYGDLFVTDGIGSVLRLSYGEGSWNTEVIADYDTSGGLINWPSGIAVDSYGGLTVANPSVFYVGDEGSYVYETNDGIYSYDTGSIFRVNPSTGETLKLATYHSTDGDILSPAGITIDDRGFLYIVDDWNSAIFKVHPYSGETKFVASYDTTDGLINWPTGIAIDDNDNDTIFITDTWWSGDTETGSLNGGIVRLPKTTNDDVLLAFANKLRADIVTHDIEFTASAHTGVISDLDGVIEKLQNNIDSDPNGVDYIPGTVIFDALESARDDFIAHAGLEEVFSHVDVSHLLLDALKMADDSVFLNIEEIEADVTLASEYLTNHDPIFSDTEHQDLESKINSIIFNIGIVKSDIGAWGAADEIEYGLEDLFGDLVSHISPGNNPFHFLQPFTNTDAVDMMLDNGVGGAFVPGLMVNNKGYIKDNDTLTVGIRGDGALGRGGYGLSIDGFANNGEPNGNVLSESYGVSYDVGLSSFVAKIGSEGNADPLTYDTTIYTKGNENSGETFTHKVGVDRSDLDSLIYGNLNITHKFELIPPPDDAPEGWSRERMLAVTVTMTNTGSSAMENLKYRRLVDFDNGYPVVEENSDFTVPSLDGVISSGDATLTGIGAPEYVSGSNPSSDPMTIIGNNLPDTYTGNLEALIQFDLYTLAAGESKEFSFFYAGDESETALEYTIDEAVRDAAYVTSSTSESQPYHTFALGTGSSIDSFSEADVEGKEADHFNILTDSLSLMLRDLALDTADTYTAKTVADNGIYGPMGVAIDSNGDLIVAEAYAGAVLKIEKDDDPESETGYKNTVTVIADSDTYDTDHNKDYWVYAPTAVAIDNNGNIIVGDKWGNAILKIEKSDSETGYGDPDSDILTVVADYNTYDDYYDAYGWIDDPMGVAIDNDGNIIIAEEWNEAILKIEKDDDNPESLTGYKDTVTVVAEWYSNSAYLIDGPTDVAVDKNGDIIVTDWDTEAVLRVDPVTGETEVIADFSSTGGLISSPQGIAIDSNGLLVVTDGGSGAVFKIDPVPGETLGDTKIIATNSTTDGKIDDPYGLAIDSEGSIYVGDVGSSSIVKLEQSTSTDYLLAFAQKIRGDMVTHDGVHPGDSVSQDEHQAFIDMLFNETTGEGIIADIETNISNPNTVDKMEIFDDLRVARENLMVHADMKEPVQHASIAHILLDSKRLADDQVRLNLVSIDEEINQAKNFLEEHINDFGDTTVHRDIRYQMASIITNINTVKGNIYDTATASAISSQVKEAFCDVIDHMVHSDAGHGHEGHHEENPFVFCHHDEG